MKYKGKDINLMNFQEEFKGASPELLDEVVTSIVYNVEIGPFLEKYPNNPELIKQIKWGILENLPIRYFKLGNARVIKRLREAYKAGLVLTNSEFETLVVLDWDVALLYIDWLEHGVVLNGYNIRSINVETAKNITPYLYEGKDMGIYFNGRKYSSFFIGCIEELRARGVNVEKFLKGQYSEKMLLFLSSQATGKVFEKLVEVVTPGTSLEVIRALESVLTLGIIPNNLVNNIENINPNRLVLVEKAYREGMDWEEFDTVGIQLSEAKRLFKVRQAELKAKRITL